MEDILGVIALLRISAEEFHLRMDSVGYTPNDPQWHRDTVISHVWEVLDVAPWCDSYRLSAPGHLKIAILY